MSTIAADRMLVSNGPDAKDYEVTTVMPGASSSSSLQKYRSGGVNGESADDTAIRNLIDLSERIPGVLELLSGDELIFRAEGGIGFAP